MQTVRPPQSLRPETSASSLLCFLDSARLAQCHPSTSHPQPSINRKVKLSLCSPCPFHQSNNMSSSHLETTQLGTKPPQLPDFHQALPGNCLRQQLLYQGIEPGPALFCLHDAVLVSCQKGYTRPKKNASNMYSARKKSKAKSEKVLQRH